MSVRPRAPPAWPILIAGGGLPSLALALALRRAAPRTVAVTVCDPRQDRPTSDPRAFALSPGATAMLDRLGVWADLRARSQPITAMTIGDGRPDDALRPPYLGFGGEGEALGHMIEADVLGAALAAACRDAGVAFVGASVEGAEAGPDVISLGLSTGQPRTASLLVAADGGRSRLREAAGIGWVGRPYGQSGIVGTIRHERDHGGRAVQHFLPAGPFALLPLVPDGGGHRSSIVWTETTPRADALLEGSPDDCAEEVRRRVGAGLGALALAGPLRAHPLSVGLARRFVAPRLALLGDAAHEFHPLAGQGLNLGLADAAALAERVVDAVRLGLDPGSEAVLAGYERDRRADAVLLAATTDGLNRLFSNNSLALRLARDVGLGLVERSPGLKRFFAAQAAGRTARAPRLMRGEAI